MYQLRSRDNGNLVVHVCILHIFRLVNIDFFVHRNYILKGTSQFSILLDIFDGKYIRFR